MLAINYMEKGRLMEAKLLLERLAEESNSFYKIHYVSDAWKKGRERAMEGTTGVRVQSSHFL